MVLVGKYVELQDAYISVVEAMKHAGYAFDADVEVKWINAEEVNDAECCRNTSMMWMVFCSWWIW